MFKISTITIIKEVKEIHPEYIALIKVGKFYKAYGKDAYIVSYIFKYRTKKEAGIAICGFPEGALNRVEAKLESEKINYLLLDKKDNYSVNEKVDFKNLNNYEKKFEKSKIYVNNMMRIENITQYLEMNADDIELKKMLIKIEETINGI